MESVHRFIDRLRHKYLPIPNKTEIVERHSIEAESKEDEAFLPLSQAHGTGKREFLTRLMVSGALLTMCIASFLAGGYFLPADGCRMRNFDHYDYLPESIRDHFFKPGNAQSFTKFTHAEDCRDEIADIDSKPWRSPPGPELDKYYNDLILQHHIFLSTTDDLRRMRKDPALYVHIPEEWGYGDRRYITKFDHTHQMHFFWMLKMLINPDHYHHYNMSHPHDRNHIEHCTWALHDWLTCHVTLDVYNYKWVDGLAVPEPEFSSQRQCRSMDEIMSFYEANDVSNDARIAYIAAGPDDYVHPISAEHRRLQQYMIDQEDSKAEGEQTWMEFTRERFDRTLEEWKRTGVVPQTDPSSIRNQALGPQCWPSRKYHSNLLEQRANDQG